jgi:hypothetical protein
MGEMLHKMMYGEMPPEGADKIPWSIKLGIRLGGGLMQRLITPQRIREVARF